MKEANFSLLGGVLAVILAACVLLAGCGSDDDSAAEETVTSRVTSSAGSTTTVTSSPEAAAQRQAQKPRRLKQFQTPTHNIGCYLSRQQGGSVRCDIREHSWNAPPKPDYCDVDWGGGLQVGSKRRGSIVCAGDTVLDPGSPVLPYGKVSEVARIVCRSNEGGVRCLNFDTGHGFFLSRQRYDLF